MGHHPIIALLLCGQMTKDTDEYLVFEIYQVLPTGWANDQGYGRVPGLRNFTKFYLRDGRMSKDTNKYLVSEILRSATYGVDG